MLGLIITIVLGLVIGMLAKFIMPGDDPGGIIITTLIGIAGSAVGGWLAGVLGLAANGGMVYQIILGVVGALVLLAIYRVIRGRSLRG